MMERIGATPVAKRDESDRLAEAFRSMRAKESIDKRLFLDLESDLENAGFSIAEVSEVFEKMHGPELLCRSESFRRVVDAIVDGEDIKIENTEDAANMCVMAGGDGFRVAMMEGFSGKDVDGMVKVVVSFRKDHLMSTEPIARDSQLWESKPETAGVSLRGRGTIASDDIEMVSFRFPTGFFPEDMMTEDEIERLDSNSIRFIVRHYIKTKSRTYHH